MILICSVLAWSIAFSVCWTLFHQSQTGFMYVKRLHNVPCYKCKYFTNSCHLKCTVNPLVACSEAAIDCRDYQSVEQL